jgi:hypothetical protein
VIERFPRLSSLEFLDRNLSGHFCADTTRIRIATVGLAMPTASLALPAHQVWMSQGPARGSAILGPAGRSRIVIWGISSARGGSHGRSDHAQSVHVPARHALCSNLCWPKHRGCTSGAARPFLFLTDSANVNRCFGVPDAEIPLEAAFNRCRGRAPWRQNRDWPRL